MSTQSQPPCGLFGSRRTSTSTSLSGAKSSRTIEPKKENSERPHFWQNCAICCGVTPVRTCHRGTPVDVPGATMASNSRRRACSSQFASQGGTVCDSPSHLPPYPISHQFPKPLLRLRAAEAPLRYDLKLRIRQVQQEQIACLPV